jgi:plasmid stabilization system protein ParE
MKADLGLHPAASEEVAQAFGWYAERSQAAARAFLAELERGFELIVESP